MRTHIHSLVYYGVLFIFCCLLPVQSSALKIQDYTYLYQYENFQKEITIHIEYFGSRVEVTYFNEFGDKDVSVFKNKIQPINVTYYNPSRERTGKTTYDYKKKKIYIQGEMNAVYNLIEPVFDNNGANFYVFSILHPEPEKTIYFRVVQSDLTRITDGIQRFLIRKLVGPVEMQLKHLGEETITINSQAHATIKYEFSIKEGGSTSMFWSHKYYYWYSSEKNILLKQQGMSQDKKPNFYTLIDFVEWERPDPVLPSL